jgi:hypothetical protein
MAKTRYLVLDIKTAQLADGHEVHSLHEELASARECAMRMAESYPNVSFGVAQLLSCFVTECIVKEI